MSDSRAWLLLTLLLGGCVAGSPTQWGAADHDPSLERAIYECQADVRSMTYSGAAFGGVVVPIAALVRRPGLFNECMVGRGYQRAP